MFPQVQNFEGTPCLCLRMAFAMPAKWLIAKPRKASKLTVQYIIKENIREWISFVVTIAIGLISIHLIGYSEK